MDRSLALLAIGLIFGGGIGFVIAAANNVTLNGHEHGAQNGHEEAEMGANDALKHGQSSGHAHGNVLSLPAGDDAPTVTIQVLKDPMSGWNLFVGTENFRFAAQHASQPHIAGEGHAHVYVNGVKIARLYGPWMHIPALPQGVSEVKVVLNSNDHRPLAVDDIPISATATVTASVTASVTSE
jgi:hypothetical protein